MEPDVFSYSSAISACERCGRWEEVPWCFVFFRCLGFCCSFLVLVYIVAWVLITVAGTAGGGDAAASALFFCPTYCIILLVWYVIYFYVAVAAEDQHAMLKVN